MSPHHFAAITRPELVVPAELAGTFAERLARVRAEAGFALWAVQHGADWATAWGTCERPDWLVDAVALCKGYEPRGPEHARMVALLCDLVRDVAAELKEVVGGGAWLGLKCATAWARGEVNFFSAVGAEMRARESLRLDPAAERAMLDLDALGPDDAFDRRREAARVAAYFAVAATVSPATPVRCARALAAAKCGRLACPELARRVAAVFECPVELRVASD